MSDSGRSVQERAQASPRSILIAVGFSVFVAADDLTVVTTMLRPIINDLGLTLPDGLDDAAWIVNVYLIAFVSVMPLAGRLSDVIGRRRLFAIAWTFFLVGTIVIPLSSTMTPFLIGRVLTAIGGGAMVPVALAVVGEVYDDAKRARALGTLGAIETLGWVWGPLYGALLVRFLTWRWQFWLNIPLAVIGFALTWRALAGLDAGRRVSTAPAAQRGRSVPTAPGGNDGRSVPTAPGGKSRVNWAGAILLSLTLIALNVGLLGNAEIQSVAGLEDLQGGTDFDFRWLLLVAAVLGGLFWWNQRRSADPLISPAFFAGRNLRIALFVNLLVGAALIVAMVDVPLFVNAIEVDLERSAVLAGWILASLTAAMTLASWLGGRLTESFTTKWPTVLGMTAATIALVAMGLTWTPDLSYVTGAFQLGLLGAGLGLVFAPTTAIVVEASPPHQRGAAAAIVMIVRLIGLSVGLAALTAWALSRFNTLRREIELPPITDPDFQNAITEASAELTADAISETFLAAAALTAVGIVTALVMRTRKPRSSSEIETQENAMETIESSSRLDSPSGVPRWALAVAGIALIGTMIALALVVFSVRSTQSELADTRAELAQTQEDLTRVEQGAAGSAIVATQVLELTRQLAELEPQISAGLDEAIVELEDFSNSTLEFSVAIDRTVEIDTEITIDRDFQFPINETITINETLPINQTVDTTIEIDTGLGFDVPVDVTVPVDVDVPVNVDVPINLDVDVPINETVPVNAEIPINLDVPIEVDIAETDLNTLAEQLANGLREIQTVVGNLAIG